MSMSAISSTAGTVAKNNYKFNAGTELTESFDINYYETYFRQYDPQLGRFTGVDALAEQTLSWSPYQFGYNNPALFNDPTGLLSDAQWNDFLKRLHSGNFGEFGGYYKTGGSDQFTEYRSEDEAFGFAAWEMNYTYGWGSYQGWATSFAHALSRYTRLKKGANLKGVLAGVVAAYFTNQWRGEASNITANHSYENKVDGFAISMTINGNRYNNTYFISENFIRGTFAFLNSLYNGQQGSNFSDWLRILSNVSGAAGVGGSVKNEMIEYGIRERAGLTRRGFSQLSGYSKAASRVRAVGATGAKYLKYSKGVGVFGNVVSGASAVVQMVENPTGGNAARVAVQGLAVGAAFIPVVGWGISLGIGAADLIWGDQFYNWIDSH